MVSGDAAVLVASAAAVSAAKLMTTATSISVLRDTATKWFPGRFFTARRSYSFFAETFIVSSYTGRRSGCQNGKVLDTAKKLTKKAHQLVGGLGETLGC